MEAPASGGPTPGRPRPGAPGHALPSTLLGLQVRDLDKATARRLDLPPGMEGVVVTSVEPMGAAEEAGVERGDVILEVNRQPVRSMTEYLRLAGGARAGDVLALYCYMPSLGQRALRAVRVEPWEP
jgi:serine protease Do